MNELKVGIDNFEGCYVAVFASISLAMRFDAFSS